jgi:hypothetical protein
MCLLCLVSLSVLDRSAFSYVIPVIRLLRYRRVAPTRVLCQSREHRDERGVRELGEGFGSSLKRAVFLSD